MKTVYNPNTTIKFSIPKEVQVIYKMIAQF